MALAEVTFELTEFLVDVLGVTDTGSEFEGRLTYHASCHNLREMEVDRQPRTLLSNVEGAEFVELNGHDECCGFGGLFAIKNAEISTAMGQRKCANLAQTDADIVTLCDVSCMTHINGLLERQGQHIRAVHIAEVLNFRRTPDERLQAPPPDLPQTLTRPISNEPKDDEQNRPRRWQDIR
jgi:L-lactate dehydrogenase complex protein LldE